jgi:hypothetical protein
MDLSSVNTLFVDRSCVKHIEQNMNINIKDEDKIMKQVAADLSAAMVMAGFVTVMTVWMMVLAG